LKKLTPRHQQAIKLLVSGKNQKSVAALLQVREETVSRWMSEPIFKESLGQACTEICEETLDRAQVATRVAFNTLVKQAEMGSLQAAIALMKFATDHTDRKRVRAMQHDIALIKEAMESQDK
jgi:FixJ family two-component response regulator